MANLSYTVGNWSIVSREVDTITVPKSMSVTDLDYAHDYSVAASSAGRSELLNISGSSLEPVERFRYTDITVDNIFHGIDVPDSARLCPKKGRGVLVETIFFLEATNGVSGETLMFPLRFQTKVESITHNVVAKPAIDWALARHIGACLQTGSTDGSLLLAAFRGDTDPTK